ncbi:MAG TPA: glycosyltransferase family 4 protein [Longimicrobiaceae bacterium]|nr:glycosyltransferase family 4 protein [Longimicrobiaceae bacterium]
MPLRLLYVSHSLPPPGRPLANVGGMQRVATELHAALQAHPEVRLSSLVLRSSWRWTHLRVVPFGASLLWRIPAVVRRKRIEVVLFYSMVTAALAIPLRRRVRARGARLVAIANGLDVTLPVGAYQRFVPRVFAALDAVVPISRATGAECLQRGLPPEKLHVIPCGVDPERFPAAPEDRTAARRTLLEEVGASLSKDALLLCSVGRLVERKGVAWFMESVMPLLPRDVHYWVAGEGPMRGAIEEAIARHGLRERVRLLGLVPEETLIRLYRGADLFVMPNVPVPGDMEGFGVVMLEAGLCGLPTVAARLEGIQDVIAEGENGHLVTSEDAAAFARAILRYHRDPEALAAASARAARRVMESFTWRAVADEYVRFLSGSPQADELA